MRDLKLEFRCIRSSKYEFELFVIKPLIRSNEFSMFIDSKYITSVFFGNKKNSILHFKSTYGLFFNKFKRGSNVYHKNILVLI